MANYNYDESYDDKDFYDNSFNDEAETEDNYDINEECEHVDDDGDGYCDYCGEPMPGVKVKKTKKLSEEGNNVMAFVNDIKKSESEKNDWEKYGLDKTYPNEEFDIQKAAELYWTMDEEGELDIKSQLESIRYCAYFAKRNVNEAKNFIICNIIQNKESCADDSVYQLASASFVLFFRNYLRKIVDEYINTGAHSHNNQNLTPSQFNDIKRDYLQVLWEHVFSKLDSYDIEKADKLNTFFKVNYLKGVLADYEARITNKKYKANQYLDRDVVRVRKLCFERGIQPTAFLISQMLGKTVTIDAIEDSLRRIEIENTAVSLDEENTRIAVTDSKEQETFIKPEDYVLQQEKNAELIEAIETIDEERRKIFFAVIGVAFVDGKFINIPQKKESEVAKEFNLTSDQVRAVCNSVTKDILNLPINAGKKKDEILSGRGLFYTADDDEELLSSLIDDIDDFSDF